MPRPQKKRKEKLTNKGITMANSYKQKGEDWVNNNTITYGTLIKVSDLLPQLGVSEVDDVTYASMTRAEQTKSTKDLSLQELNATNVIRNILLQKGMHFHKKDDYYRVALPSENSKIASNWETNAQRKVERAQVLLANTTKNEFDTEQANNHNNIVNRLFSSAIANSKQARLRDIALYQGI